MGVKGDRIALIHVAAVPHITACLLDFHSFYGVTNAAALQPKEPIHSTV